MLVWGRSNREPALSEVEGSVSGAGPLAQGFQRYEVYPVQQSLQTLCNSSPISMQLSWCTWVYHPREQKKTLQSPLERKASAFNRRYRNGTPSSSGYHVHNRIPASDQNQSQARPCDNHHVAANSILFRGADPANNSATEFANHLGRASIRTTRPRSHYHYRSRRNQHRSRAHASHPEPLHSSRRRYLRPSRFSRHRRQPSRHPSRHADSRKSRQARPKWQPRRTLSAVHVDNLPRRLRSAHLRPITLESDDGYALKDPGQGRIIGAVALPAAGFGLGALIGHSVANPQPNTITSTLPPGCTGPPPGCLTSSVTGPGSAGKSTVIGAAVGAAIGMVASLTLLFRSHNFFLDVGSPVEMVLSHALTLEGDQVATPARDH
jgi:hypothetical protein